MKDPQQKEAARARARETMRHCRERGEPMAWFEAFYAAAEGDPSAVPWADFEPSPHLVTWLANHPQVARGRTLEVGCGLGDNGELLAAHGFQVTSFDLSPTAITWCRKRFPRSKVDYQTADLLHPPTEWRDRFDLVFEANTLQVLEPELRAAAMRSLAGFVAPDGLLLVICRAREPEDPPGEMPWPLTRTELLEFEKLGLKLIELQDVTDHDEASTRRFQACFQRRR